MAKPDIKRTTKVEVSGEIDINDLYVLVQEAVPNAPPDATIEIYVRVPGGGDWSNENLNIGSRHASFY